MAEIKKKLIHIKGVDSGPYSIKSKFINYALVSSPKDGRRQIHKLFSCRDYLHDVIRAYIHKGVQGTGVSYINENSPPIDLERLRIMVTSYFGEKEDVVSWKEKLFSAKRIINIYEEIAGFDSLTKITTATNKYHRHCWLFTGPKDWMRVPQALSMFTLILRLLAYTEPAKVENIKDVNTFWEKLVNDRKYEKNYDVRSYLPNCYDKFEMIMKNFDNIFTQPFAEAYPITNNSVSFHSAGGIVSLCTNKTQNKVLEENFKREWEKWKESKEVNK